MGLTIQQGQTKVKAAWRFQTNAEFREIRLLDCSATLAEGFEPAAGRLRLSLEFDSRVLEAPSGAARFAVRATVRGNPKDADASQEVELLTVSCRYALEYTLRPSYTPSQEDLDAFKEGNAVFHCWPYFREMVQNVTMRMGLQITPLPLLRLAAKPGPKRRRAELVSEAPVKAVADDGKTG
jgi:hypothetical protein